MKIMWMMNIVNVVLKYVWQYTCVLAWINQKLIFIVSDPLLGYMSLKCWLGIMVGFPRY
jgi:hypothetical protein